MINSAVTCWFDCCHNLPYGIGGYSVSQLQLNQNNAARIVSLWWKYDHITPVLKYAGYQLKFCCLPTRLNMAWLHPICRLYYRMIIIERFYDLRTNVSLGLFDITRKVLQVLLCPCFPLPLEHATYISLGNPLSFSRATWGHKCLMVHIHNVTWYFIIIILNCCQLLAGVYLIS